MSYSCKCKEGFQKIGSKEGAEHVDLCEIKELYEIRTIIIAVGIIICILLLQGILFTILACRRISRRNREKEKVKSFQGLRQASLEENREFEEAFGTDLIMARPSIRFYRSEN